MHNLHIEPELINEIQQKNDILDVVSQYVKLEKRGRNYIGLCPFHDEKTPSFSVSVEKQICHCFGCKKGGNVFQFLEQIESISFIEAVKILGERAGIEVKTDDDTPKPDNEQSKMIAMHEAMAHYYNYVLKAIEQAEPALKYLYSRGFTDEQIAREKIGYSPNVSTFTRDYLKNKGYDEALAYDAGLLSRNEETISYFDRFRNRIMFPIKDFRGKVIGFSARSIDGSEPKYLNSPETLIFQKRNVLYHIDVARKPIRNNDEVILLEGFMDVLKLNEVGILNAIATMGTALSREHVLQLKKLASNITLMYDGDRAGIDATLKIGKQLNQEGMNVFVVPMKKGYDPDEMITELGTDKFLSYFNHNKLTYVSFYMRHYLDEIKNNDLAYEKHLNNVIQDAKLMNSEHLQKKVLHEITELFNVDFDSLKFKVQKENRTQAHMPTFESETLSRQMLAERTVLKYFMNDRMLFMQFKDQITEAHFSAKVHQMIYEALSGYYKIEETFKLSNFSSHVPHECHETCLKIDAMHVNHEPSIEEVNDYLYVFQQEPKEIERLQSLKAQLSDAVRTEDHERRAQLMREIINLQRQKKQ
ncbi:MAG: DNA primase [Macrococcus canis]|uniref:DNA primase n=1 Tax=Macrococcoides canis TaxID=1855823 RepID=UPI001F400971|nr:DNA primase [Macrococcus canis]MEE1106719.1 DNA primase [Macrococcus canis]